MILALWIVSTGLPVVGLPDFCMEEIFEWRMFAGIDSGPLLIRSQEDRRAVNGAIVYATGRRATTRAATTGRE